MFLMLHLYSIYTHILHNIYLAADTESTIDQIDHLHNDLSELWKCERYINRPINKRQKH